MKYRDRADAGKQLASMLNEHAGSNALILAIPNGGVPVGIEIAKDLQIEIDVMITRRINLPFTTESGFGAVSFDGQLFIDKHMQEYYHIDNMQLARLVLEAEEQVKIKVSLFNFDKNKFDVEGKTVILVDDGIAGGFTMRVSLQVLEKYRPRKRIVAVPTAPARSLEKVRAWCEEIVCPDIKREARFAVAAAYRHWRDLHDQETARMFMDFRGNSM